MDSDRRSEARHYGPPDQRSHINAAGLNIEELRAALSRIGPTNDMLPPREDDKIADLIADRFTHALAAQITAGNFAPSPGSMVAVSKNKFATRPAMLLRFEDRIVFEALVERMKASIESYLVSNDAVLWPRGKDSDKQWQRFNDFPLMQGGGFVVDCDVAGFYESIDHFRLRRELIRAGCKIADVDQLCEFLRIVMAGHRGLPQGITSCDALATCYLATADAKLRRAGLAYVRHGDDMKISVATYVDGLQAIATVEAALREASLLMNASKARITPLSTYAKHMADVQNAKSGFTSKMIKAKEEAILRGDLEDVDTLLHAAGYDSDAMWKLGYDGVELSELLSLVRGQISPPITAVIEEMFRDAMVRKPGSSNPLPRELWHMRILYCLQGMAGANSTAGLPYMSDILLRSPEETQNAASYLLSIADANRERVAKVAEYILIKSSFVPEWQRGWLYRVLSRCAKHVTPTVLQDARRRVTQEGDWFARVEAARLVAMSGGLVLGVAQQLFDQCPDAYRAEVVGIVARLEHNNPWVTAFLDGASQDPISAVVIEETRAQTKENLWWGETA